MWILAAKIKYISCWEVVTRTLIFSGRHDLRSDASQSIFFFCLFKKYKVLHCHWLTVSGCLISPKCLLDLHNSKQFSLCPWMWLFPAKVLSRWAQLVTVFNRMFKFSRIVIYRAKSRRSGLEWGDLLSLFKSQYLFIVSWRVQFFSNLGKHRSAISNLCSARRAKLLWRKILFPRGQRKVRFSVGRPTLVTFLLFW